MESKCNSNVSENTTSVTSNDENGSELLVCPDDVNNVELNVSKDKVLSNLEIFELFNASLLRQESDIDLERDSDILQRIGVVYYLRALITKVPTDFIKASALYNSALIRTKQQEKDKELRFLIKINEQAFLKFTGIDTCNQNLLPTNFTPKFQDVLTALRNYVKQVAEEAWRLTKVNFSVHAAKNLRTEEEMILIRRVKALSKYICNKLKLFFKDILQECYKILGPSPQKFTVVGLGSLAREEMTPFSDLEFIILIENDTNDKQYFQNLTHLFQLFVINLGETPLPALAVKSLNDFTKEGGDWFYDSITSNGICFDGALPWASKTPTGLPGTKSKPAIELIKTPENMVKHVQYEVAIKEGYHLADILRTATHIDGCKKLLDKFNELCQAAGSDPDVKYNGLKRLREDAKQFSDKMLLDRFMIHITGKRRPFRNLSQMLNVKKTIYRLPSIVTNNFKLIYNLSNNTSWELLDEMSQTRHLLTEEDAHNIQVAVSIAVFLRLMTYFKNKGQRENLTFLKEAKYNGQETKLKLKAHFCDNEQLIFRFYFTISPLVYKLLSTDSVTRNPQHLSDCLKNLYDDNYHIQGNLYSVFLSPQNAIDCYKKRLLQKSKLSLFEQAEVMRNISYCYIDLGDYDNALFHEQQRLELLNCMPPGSRVSWFIADSHFLIGDIHFKKINYKEALKSLGTALSIIKSIHNPSDDKQRFVAALLKSMGNVYASMDNTDNALSLLHQCLEIQKRVFGNRESNDIANTLDDIGNVHHSLGDNNKSLKYHQEALQMQRQIYGEAAHPHVAGTLSNIANVFKSLGNNDNALRYHQEALQIRKRIHGAAGHRDVASSLNNIGSVYHSLGDNKKALIFVLEALQMMKHIYGEVVHRDVASFLNNLATVYQSLGCYDKSLIYHIEALQVRKKIFGDEAAHPDVANSLYDIANVYQILGDNDNALIYHQLALQMRKEIYGETAHPDILSSLKKIATMYVSLGDNCTALIYHQEALQVGKEIYGEGAHSDVANSLNNIALVYKNLDNIDNALICSQEALQMQKQIHGEATHPEVAGSLLVAAMIYVSIGSKDYGAALKYAHQSVQMYKELNIPYKTVHTLIFLSGIYADKLDVDNMSKYMQEAAEIMESLDLTKFPDLVEQFSTLENAIKMLTGD